MDEGETAVRRKKGKERQVGKKTSGVFGLQTHRPTAVHWSAGRGGGEERDGEGRQGEEKSR